MGSTTWADVDNAWEQEKLEARKMLLNRADSHTSGATYQPGKAGLFSTGNRAA
jgi:hypothetical protein